MLLLNRLLTGVKSRITTSVQRIATRGDVGLVVPASRR